MLYIFFYRLGPRSFKVSIKTRNLQAILTLFMPFETNAYISTYLACAREKKESL